MVYLFLEEYMYTIVAAKTIQNWHLSDYALIAS